MQLHRAGKEADWQSVPAQNRTGWQRLAAATKGYVTPGNAITLTGLAVVLLGGAEVYRQHYWAGLAAIAVGRLADLADGWVADKTGTKNRVGEFLDAVADKVAVIALLVLFFAANLAPWWILVLMLAPHAAISLVPFWSLWKHTWPHPSRVGKYAMAAVWLVLGAYVLLHAVHRAHGGLMDVLDAVALLTAAAGFYAAAGYFRQSG